MQISHLGITGLFFYPRVDHVILGKIFSLGTIMYRFMNYKMIVLISSVLLTACGQSGALHLPSDVNADKRVKYLIYPDTPAQQKQDKETTTAPAEVSNSNPTP